MGTMGKFSGVISLMLTVVYNETTGQSAGVTVIYRGGAEKCDLCPELYLAAGKFTRVR